RSVEHVRPLRWRIEASENVHERRFTGPGSPHDRDHLTRGHGQVYTAQCEHAVRTHTVDLLHCRDLNHRLRCHTRLRVITVLCCSLLFSAVLCCSLLFSAVLSCSLLFSLVP